MHAVEPRAERTPCREIVSAKSIACVSTPCVSAKVEKQGRGVMRMTFRPCEKSASCFDSWISARAEFKTLQSSRHYIVDLSFLFTSRIHTGLAQEGAAHCFSP